MIRLCWVRRSKVQTEVQISNRATVEILWLYF
nr:MAG TPA: hypothetical protein [Caudoviricetes sp.]